MTFPGRALRLTFSVNLLAGIKYDEQAKVHVTYAPALEVYSQGETPMQAKRALTSAIRMFLTVAYEKGVLERMLTDAGFTATQGQLGAPREGEAQYIDVVEEEILERRKFEDFFQVPAALSLTSDRLEAVPA